MTLIPLVIPPSSIRKDVERQFGGKRTVRGRRKEERRTFSESEEDTRGSVTRAI